MQSVAAPGAAFKPSDVAIHQVSKPHEIAKRLNAQYRAIEKSSDEMGRDLILLKRAKPLGIEWGVYLKELGIEFSREYADRLIRRIEPKKRIEPKPAPEPSSEPDADIFDEFPDQKTLKPAEQKTLYEEGCALLARMDRQTRLRLFKHQEEKYFACFEEERDRFKEQIAQLNSEIAKLRQKLDPGRCGWVKDDGGRGDAGHKEPAGDCVARAIAIATGKPYPEVYEALKAEHAKYVKHPHSFVAKHNGRRRTEPIENGCSPKVYGSYLKSIGWEYTEPKECTYLRADQLPRGRLVVMINRHAVAVIDGEIHDMYDSGGAGKRPVEGYWSQPQTITAPAVEPPIPAHETTPPAVAADPKNDLWADLDIPQDLQDAVQARAKARAAAS